MLKQYAEDWGYGGKLGFIHNRRKHPECSWEVPMAVNDLYTQFSMGKAPVKPLSPQELKDALHVGRPLRRSGVVGASRGPRLPRS